MEEYGNGWQALSQRTFVSAGTLGVILTLVLTVGLSSAGAALPDGRAYEQVSPVNKNGASAQGAPGFVHAASDGSSFSFISQSPLPGAESAQDFGTYLSTRNSSQWSTQGQLPPPPTGNEGLVRGQSPDLRYSYVSNLDFETFIETMYQRDNQTHELTVMAEAFSPTIVAVSTDDSRVLFESEILFPAAGGVIEGNNLFVWDRESDSVYQVGVLNTEAAPPQGAVAGPYSWPSKNLANGGAKAALYTENVFSHDGNDLYFTALGSGELYLRTNILAPQSQLDANEHCTEPSKACTIALTQSTPPITDPNGAKPAAYLTASSVGPSTAFFLSAGKLTADATTGPADEGSDLYKYSAAEGLADLTVDPVGPTDPNGAEVRGVLGASKDGDRLYFVANGVLGDAHSKGGLPGTCSSGQSFEVGECNLYLWEKGHPIEYIARLDADGAGVQSDSEDWNPEEGQAGEANTSRVSDNGEIAVFRSQNALTAYESAGTPEFYRFDAGASKLECITCNPSGGAPVAPPLLSSINLFIPPSIRQGGPQLLRNLSSDGSRFVFETSDQLVPTDVNGESGCPQVAVPHLVAKVFRCQDVYEWEAAGTGSCASTEQDGGCLYLISTGTSPEPSYLGEPDESGANIFFFTQDKLVGQDKDAAVDVYDARVGGGLISQNPPPSIPCSSQVACQGAVASPPQSASPASAGPLEKAKRPYLECRKGFKKRRHRGKPMCVKQHKHHSKHSHRKSGGSM